MQLFLWTLTVHLCSGIDVLPWVDKAPSKVDSVPSKVNTSSPVTSPAQTVPEANKNIISHRVPQASANKTQEQAAAAVKAMQSAPIAQPVRLRMEAKAEEVKAENGTAGTQPLMMPKVYFLFLAMDKISNFGIWKSFFASAPIDMYRVFVHCKFREPCATQFAGSVFQLVDTVPSYYCTDLVSPMSQLLNFALQDSGHIHPNDKFAFISDSTLPGKPFSHVHAALSGRPGSDFCVFPMKEAADQYNNGQLNILPKHHQWSVLGRDHAQRSMHLWRSGTMHDIMYRWKMNTQALTYGDNTYADQRNFGCLDEFWHMAALYGVLYSTPHRNNVVSLPKFTGGQLSMGADAGWQGMCDTFVIWAKYMGKDSGASNPFYRLMQSLDPPSIPHGGNNQRPGWWDQMSRQGMTALRRSDFLFIRKFIDRPYLTDGGDFENAYIQQVLM
jgi:hypothetical protein